MVLEHEGMNEEIFERVKEREEDCWKKRARRERKRKM